MEQSVDPSVNQADFERAARGLSGRKPIMAICCAVTAAAVVLCVVLFVCVLRGGGADKGVSTSGDDTRIEEDEKDASAAEEQDAEEDEEDAESEEDEAEASDDEEDIFYADERVDSILSAIEDAEVRDTDGDYVRLDFDTIVGYQILDWNDDGNPEVFINVSGEPYIIEYLQ